MPRGHVCDIGSSSSTTAAVPPILVLGEQHVVCINIYAYTYEYVYVHIAALLDTLLDEERAPLCDCARGIHGYVLCAIARIRL